MKVRIRYVVNPGDMDRERLVMQVRRDVDIGNFMLVRTGFEDDEVTTSVSHAFWFPDKQLRAGDLVVVYSKAGNDNQKLLDDGQEAHFFYWDQKSPLWDDGQFVPVLFYTPQWTSKAPEELSVQR